MVKDSQGALRIFDEVIYLYLNPDVAAKISAGEAATPIAHYLKSGQYESRKGVPLLDDVFDEDVYLAENPDVANAVDLGHFKSGRAHFIEFGHNEGRSGAPEVDATNPPELLFPGPLPPPNLRKRVHGVVQRYSFERVGKAVAETLSQAVADNLPHTFKQLKILDFGCGCARVLPYFKQTRDMEIVGSDIDEEAIVWCQENLSGFGAFFINGAMPPLDFPADTFDVIYSVSVMTHLPEKMQTAWLKELSRVAKPRALLLLTTRGIHGVHLTRLQQLQFRLRGFYYGGGRLTLGLPRFYRSAFHTEAYVHKFWGKHFEILEFRARGLNNDQDLVICRKLT